jgi:hypothetical protein
MIPSETVQMTEGDFCVRAFYRRAYCSIDKVQEDAHDREKALADRCGKGSGTERWPRAVPFDSTLQQCPLSNRAERG